MIKIMIKSIPYGYKAWTGVVFSNTQVDAYNAIQSKISCFKDDMGYVPEYLLKASHNLFWSIAKPTKKGWE